MDFSSYFSSFFMLLSLSWTVKGSLYKAINWDPLNPIFKTANHSVLQFNVTMKSQMNIICPNVPTNLIYLENPIQKDYLYENLWFVDKESFQSCQVNTTKKSNQLLYKCEYPIKLKYRRLTFKSVSPIKGEPEFQEGMEYYFLATSNGSKHSLDNTVHGHCKTHNMRFKIYICINKNDPKCQSVQATEHNPKTTSSTPTNQIVNKEILEGVKVEQSAKKCFLTSGDKIWFIAIGVFIGVMLMCLVGCLIYTWIRRRKSDIDDNQSEDGKIPLKSDKSKKKAEVFGKDALTDDAI